MKNFEEIEHLWRQQAVVAPDHGPALRTVQNAANRVVKSRSRRLRLGVGVVLFSLFVGPLLMVLNFLYGGRTPNAVALVHLGVVVGCQIVILIALLRRLRAHRELRAKSASSVRENLQVSLALIEREQRDYRYLGLAFAVVLAFDVIPLVNGYHLGYFDRAGLIHRLLSATGFCLLIYSVALRHARRVLEPRQRELTAVLADLDAG